MRVTLTDEGEALARDGQAILNDLVQLGERLRARSNTVAGHLRVLAPLAFGRTHVAPVMSRFSAAHSGLTLDLILSDRLGLIPETAWDVAVHIGMLRDSSLIAQFLAPNDRFVCASPDYLERRGAPSTPGDLVGHSCIALRENDEDVTLWRFEHPSRDAEQVRIMPALASNDGDVVQAWAIEGHGIVVRSEWSVADDIRAGRLVRLLRDYELPSANVVALVRKPEGRSARVTQLLRELRASLQPARWR